MISFWERESLLSYDIIIVGSGIVGLQTAILLKQKFPNRSVMILERGLLPTGASTRNAGFAATGSLSELINDSKQMSEIELCQLFSQRKSGLDFLRNQLGDDAIGYENNGSYALLEISEAYVMEHMTHYNQLLREHIQGALAFQEAHEKIQEFGWENGKFKYCLRNNTEAAIDTGKLMKSLGELALQSGVQIITGAALISYEERQNRMELLVQDYFRNENIVFRTQQLVFCTNAFSKDFFPLEDMIPGRGQVIVTKPLSNLPFKGIFYFGGGYYFFRNVGNRVLFGGGRNMDFDTEATTLFDLNHKIVDHLKLLLKEQILPNLSFEIDLEWSGIMAFGKSKSPIVRRLNDRVIGGFRLGGMGVALGSRVAQDLVAQVD